MKPSALKTVKLVADLDVDPSFPGPSVAWPTMLCISCLCTSAQADTGVSVSAPRSAQKT